MLANPLLVSLDWVYSIRGAYFRDKIVSRLRSLAMIYRNSYRIRIHDRVNTRSVKKLARRLSQSRCRTNHSGRLLHLDRTQYSRGDRQQGFLFSTGNDVQSLMTLTATMSGSRRRQTWHLHVIWSRLYRFINIYLVNVLKYKWLIQIII